MLLGYFLASGKMTVISIVMSIMCDIETTNPELLTRQWFENVVLGLNLCPFAHRPARQQQIRFYVSDSTEENVLLDELMKEVQYLANTPATDCETSLVITPHLLKDFYDYQFFLEEANRRLKREQWQNVFQLASFHPHYCFAGTEPEDPSNLTNRAPLPIIHILREESISQVLENVENPEDIPQKNIETVEQLGEEQTKRVFFWL